MELLTSALHIHVWWHCNFVFPLIIVGSSFMGTHLYQEMRRLQSLVSSLTAEMDVKNERMEYMERRATDLSTYLAIMTDERDKLNQAFLQLSTSLSRMTEERDQLVQAHLEEMRSMQRIVYENETLMRDLETHSRELEQQRTEIHKREAQLDIRSNQLSVLSKEVTRKLNIVQQNSERAKDTSSRENVQALTEVDDMRRKLEEKDYELDSLTNLNNTLIAKERRSNHELQEARKVLIEGLDGFGNNGTRPPAIGIKRMGELNDKPFRDICIKKFSATEWETKSVELCSLWQNKIQDSGWYPYKHVTVDKMPHEVINEDDKKLRELRDEWGKEVFDAVATASLEMNQYNASGIYPVRELWNFKEGRQASLKEVMEYILQKLKALKSVKRRR
ncbi:factor of DNA methylation 1-like isoform X2 [Papaver somniferum]|uniref:factor of DNA methylation 1-like isoform X2 n=1 Tax=Papaver somniferum TaxID=3469 RepID=UPI000E703097|nr:factor of DNA methylation 1-like isoform X2 [Papaver somniferum]